MSAATTAGKGADDVRATAAAPRQAARRRHVSVFFMFTSFLNLALCIGFIFFAPPEWMFGLCAAAYAVVAAAELAAGIRSPVTLSLLALYGGMAVLAAFHPELQQYTQYTGVLVFGWLAVLMTALLLAGRPFTSFYARGRGLPSLQRAASYTWITADVAALAASLYFMPDLLFLFVPFGLCIAAGLTTITMNLFWFGAKNARQRRFTIGSIEAREVRPHTSDFDELCSFFTSQGAADHGEDDPGLWSEIMRQAEAELHGRSIAIGAFERDEVVGSVRCVLDRRGERLPVEEQLNTSLDGLRRHGRLLYVGRVAVDQAYRQKPEVMSALFKGMIEVALENDVSFIVVSTFINRVPTFMKLGFEPLFPRTDPRYVVKGQFGVPVIPLVLNLARLAMSGDYQRHSHQHFSAALNPYLQERWYKRVVLRHLCRRGRSRPWDCDLDTVRAAACAAGALHPAA